MKITSTECLYSFRSTGGPRSNFWCW